MKSEAQSTQLPVNLGGGLLLRRSNLGDCEALAAFNARIHSDDGPDKPDAGIAKAVRDLMSGEHPSFKADDFTLVEEQSTGRIVSCMCLISQNWTYAGIPFKVGRPELVATEFGFRDRGLVRRQFEVVHEWSRQRGEVIQVITGIPVYYRRFGYEMALDLDGSRTLYEPLLPRLKEGESESFLLRPANQQDLRFLQQLYDQNLSGSLLACIRSETDWYYDLVVRDPLSVERLTIYVVTTKSGKPVGMVAAFPQVSKDKLIIKEVDLLPSIDRYQAVRSVVRQLWQIGRQEAEKSEKPFQALQFSLGRASVVFDLLGDLLQRVREPYAWYIRVPDMLGFLRLVRPALENNLKRSSCSGYSGQLKLTLEHSAIRMDFKAGRITSIEPQQDLKWSDSDAVYPGLSFTQLLFGYRSQAELEHTFADCFAEVPATPIINALFPTRGSNVWPLM